MEPRGLEDTERRGGGLEDTEIPGAGLKDAKRPGAVLKPNGLELFFVSAKLANPFWPDEGWYTTCTLEGLLMLFFLGIFLSLFPRLLLVSRTSVVKFNAIGGKALELSASMMQSTCCERSFAKK